MATTAITLNIDTTILPDTIAALNWQAGYQAQIPDPSNPGQLMANPVTPAQNAKIALKNHVLNAVTEYHNMQAVQASAVPNASLIT